MHLHTTTGVTAAGILAPGSATASGAMADGPGQLTPMANRRNSAGAIPSGGTGTLDGSQRGGPGLSPLGPGNPVGTSAGSALVGSALGRMNGGSGGTNSTPRNVVTSPGAPGRSSTYTGSPAGAFAGTLRAGSGPGGSPVAASSGGGGGVGVVSAPSGGGGGGSRQGTRANAKDAGAFPRKVAAVENIAEALGRFFQESMELAPKPPPKPPSTTSSDDSDPGPMSSDDEGTQEEMDVLEKLYLVMPNLESPGKGATNRDVFGGRGILSQPPSRISSSFTATAGGNSRPASPMQHLTSFSPARVPPLPGGGTPAAAAAAAAAAAQPANRSSSPSPMSTAGPSSGQTPLTPLDAAVAAAKRKAAAKKAAAQQQPAFLPSKAVLLFHQRALGITVPLAHAANGPAAGGGGGSGGSGPAANGAVAGAGGAGAASSGAVTMTTTFGGPPAAAVAASSGVPGPYGSLSQPPDAPVTSAYVNRDADYLMMRQMVEAALAAGQSRPATAGAAAAAASAAAAAAAAAGRGAVLPAAPAARRGATGKSAPSGSARKKSGKKSGKKAKLPPAPPQLVPRPAVPIHLQHLVRPGSASVGALMGLHQPAGIDPAIIAAVVSGTSVDPVQGLTPPPGSAASGMTGTSFSPPLRPLSPVRPLSPLKQPGQASRPPQAAANAAPGAARPPSPLKGRAGSAAAAAAAARAGGGDEGGSGGSGGGAAGGGRSGSAGGAKARSRNASPTSKAGGTALPPARPLSSRSNGGAAGGQTSGSRPFTAPGNGNWAAGRLERLRGAAATKAAACASMSPLRASLAAPISGLRARRQSRPLTDVEFGVFNRTMDAALMPLTRAAAKLGTYGEALPPPNLFSALTPVSGPSKLPLPTVAGLAAASAATSLGGAAGGGGGGGGGSSAGAADGQVSRATSNSRSPAVVAAAALAGATTAAAGTAAPPLEAGSGGAATGSVSGGGGGGGGLMTLDEMPRRKLKRRNMGGWDWPPGQGAAPAFDVIEETRHAVAAVLAGAELDENGRSGPCDRVGEVGRLMRRFHKQDVHTSFNLSHAVNGIDQIVALVDVLGHPDLACVSELLLGGNALNDEAFAPLAGRLASAECGSLRRLDLRFNNLTAASVELLLPLMKDEVAAMSKAQRIRRGLDAGPLHGVLHRLVLDGNPIGDVGAELLCDAASSDYTHLAELRLCRCGLGERGAAAAGRLLENSNAIKILDLSWNTLGKRGGQALGEGLRNASSIQQLLVAWTGITDVGASHIAKALKSNSTLQVLDMSGDSVSGDTSLVLLDSLTENGALTHLVLRDNPVGVMAARKLLKALHQGVIESVDLLGCSFGGMGGSTVVWDPHDPDGVYDLDLEIPAHYQVAVELVGLAAHMGLRSWRASTLNGKPFRLNSTNKLQLPVRGRLHVEFVSCTPLVRDEGPLTDGEVRSMWFAIADPDGVRTPSGAMLLTEAEEEAAAAAAAAPPNSPKRGKGAAAAGGGANAVKKSPRGSSGPAAPGPAAPGKPGGAGAGAGRGRGVPAGSELSTATELKGATDEWKLQLLEALVTDVYLTCAQLKHVLRCFDGRDARTEAVVQAFGVLVDTENFWAVLDELEPGSREQVETRLGKIRMFFPENPTGRYTLMLSQLPHQCVAKQLLQQYVQQYDNKLTHHPNRVCFTACNMDGVPTDVSDPHKLYLPQEGILELCFVDLRHPPPGTRSLSRGQFAVLVAHLVNSEVLDPVHLTRVLGHPALGTAVAALRRWEAWTRNHPISANVPYLWKAMHEIRKRDDPEGAAAAEFAAAVAAGDPVATAAAAAAAAASTRRDTNTGLAGTGDAGGEREHQLPATPNSGGAGRPSAALTRLPRESSSYVLPHTPPSFRPSAANDTLTGSGPSDTTISNNRRSGVGLRESLAGIPDSPGFGAAAAAAAGGGSTGGTDAPLSQRSNQGKGARPRTAPTGPPPVYVKDMGHYVEAIRILSVRHYLTCWQLIQLLQLLPPTATDERVETVTAFWARVTDRDAHWVDVLRSLTNEQQVRACQRLGYMNVYNEIRPAMHYRLRMYKEDEHELAWQLYNKSLDSPLPCWKNLTIDDQPKRVNQGVNMWTVLRGNAADGTTPQTTLEFDFVWPDEDAQRTLAARQVQRAWRLYKNPKGGGVAVAHATRTGGAAQPRFAAFNKKKKAAATSKMNDPTSGKKK